MDGFSGKDDMLVELTTAPTLPLLEIIIVTIPVIRENEEGNVS